MKICTVSGDLSSDSYTDQYPRESLCDQCVAEDAARPDGMQWIIEIEGDDTEDSRCYSCMKWAEDEAKERSEKEG